MTTRYEFGYGYGEIYRRRMHGQDRRYRERMREMAEFSDEDRERVRYESDYYGFRGAGRRGSYASEFRVQPRAPRRMGDGGTGRRRRPAPPRPPRRPR
ncbi:MAG TPA: hypothetical protein VF158_16300 [Longimicrobiales bacterium]